ncbi:MAG: DNA-binding protein [Cyanobacteria bacterium P01_E01_bin.42]
MKTPTEMIPFNLDISPELNETLEELARKIGGTKTDVLRQGTTLLYLMLEAKEQDKKFGIAEIKVRFALVVLSSTVTSFLSYRM